MARSLTEIWKVSAFSKVKTDGTMPAIIKRISGMATEYSITPMGKSIKLDFGKMMNLLSLEDGSQRAGPW